MRVHFEAYAPRWRIPFSHHPPYCAGPMHGNSKSRACGWSSAAMVKVQGDTAEITPIGGDGRPLELRSPSGGTVPAATLVRA